MTKVELPPLPEFPPTITCFLMEPQDGPAVHAYATAYATLAVEQERERILAIIKALTIPQDHEQYHAAMNSIAAAIRQSS